MQRSFTVERRALPPRYRVTPDEAAELRALADQLRNMPRDWIASWPDLFHAMRRVGGRVAGIAERLEILPAAPPASREGKAWAPVQRERIRTLTTGKGRRVQVVHRASSQMELGL